ncbi:MAG: SAM-dependent methyltransferase [Betaproteobacteria bacterium]|nr:SAM-dependent methyltransferase [Betaproteobacteria bacterium]
MVTFAPPLSDQEFAQYQQLLHRIAGIHLSPAKKPLLVGRLGKRLQHGNHRSFGDYFRHLTSEGGRDELRIAVDLLTTNETYFFRESKHFDFLQQQVLPGHRRGAPFRVWSAACSSGEEPYSIAMTLADTLGESSWEIVASDLSTRVLERARSGHYALERAEKIPPAYRAAYCLKGVGVQEGTFLVQRKLRERVQFLQVNLNGALPRLGEFDVIFLRNVMIYFDMATKRQVVERLLPALKPGGHFLVSHSESLNGVTDVLKMVAPSIYRKP